SGRAAWLEANYRPTNYAAKPNNPAANALVLTIPTETPLVDPAASAVRAYWAAVWRARGKRDAVAQTLAAFRAAIGNDARARELIDNYEPTNIRDDSPLELPRDQVSVAVEFVEFPKRVDQASATKSWSQPARSRV